MPTKSTTHKLITCDSRKIKELGDQSVELIVTSPPYPMIEMWDEVFAGQSSEVKDALERHDGFAAFQGMHFVLNKVWEECDRVLKDNCFICINIGDATRTVNGEFNLFPNHTEIVNYFFSKGYSVLPDIHWRKHSNAPNKFMGSGMYPAGAYVTYEHEYILVFRKGGKRIFKGDEKTLRRESAYFWEERNVWFSDLWDIKGVSQQMSKNADRTRNASFPIDIPYRLVNMYSAKGDTVLDPFNGLGTTSLACMAAQRNSVGVDVSVEINNLAADNIERNMGSLNDIIDERLASHISFIDKMPVEKKDKCYKNISHGFLVKTKQETEMKLERISHVDRNAHEFLVSYESDFIPVYSDMVAEGNSLLDFNSKAN